MPMHPTILAQSIRIALWNWPKSNPTSMTTAVQAEVLPELTDEQLTAAQDKQSWLKTLD